MEPNIALADSGTFAAALFPKMKQVNPGVAELEPYEFRYGLNNLVPPEGWASVALESPAEIEKRVNQRSFYDSIQIKPRLDDRIVLDDKVLGLTRTLLAGLVCGIYTPQWINEHFYFDIRGFYFLHRSTYFNEKVLDHFGGKPFMQFSRKQKAFDVCQEIGYKEFKAANAEVDGAFIEAVKKLIAVKGTPILLAIAGPTAAGKTEIVDQLREVFAQEGRKTTSVEMDNFLTDREEREARGIFTLGREAYHMGLLRDSLEAITRGKKVSIPRYDFIFATSSHDNEGRLKPGGVPIEIEPADIIFIEGNFPFLLQEIVHLIGIKVVYLTDDAVRLKRKWRRDIDLRRKYEPTYFRNRYFKDQFIMAEVAYRPQLEICDLCVDTTGAALWVTPETIRLLESR